MCFISPHVRGSRTVLDSGFQAVDSGFQVMDSSICQYLLGFWISIVSGIPDNPWAVFRISQPRIPDSMSKLFPDSGLYKLKFAGFRNLDSITRGEISQDILYIFHFKCFLNTLADIGTIHFNSQKVSWEMGQQSKGIRGGLTVFWQSWRKSRIYYDLNDCVSILIFFPFIQPRLFFVSLVLYGGFLHILCKFYDVQMTAILIVSIPCDVRSIGKNCQSL